MDIRERQRLESLLSELLRESGGTFSEVELEEVRQFIVAGEYGLALQTFIDIAVEEDRPVPSSSVEICRALAAAMDMVTEVKLERLNSARH